jgi:cysteine desulfurase family protein
VQVYLDNAATSRQKPEEVFTAIESFYKEINCNPGRGGYNLSLESSRKVMEVRESIGKFFNIKQASSVVFTPNITVALNIALKGLLKKGDHVLISGLEHNAVVRPLTALKKYRGVEFSIIPTEPTGFINLNDVRELIKPNTKMICCTHASNVMGALLPAEELGKIAAEHDLYYVLDTAQTAGALPLDFEKLHTSVLAFTGHKHLLGPMGIGGFCIREDVARQMLPLYEGGTGSISDREEQPDFLPDKFESGTLNTLGIVGLGAGINYLMEHDLTKIRSREMALTKRLLDGLQEFDNIKIYGPQNEALQTGTIALNMDDVDNAELCFVLDQQFGIMTRPGLHCAPVAHRTMGTFPEGVLRLSVGHYTSESEIDYVLESIKQIVEAI